MRILYVVPGPMGRTPEGRAEVARRGDLLQKYAAPGTETGIEDVPEGPASVESMFEEYLSIPATARRMVELENEGWDALILGCFGDPGLDAYRELLSIPVVGPGEASALLAASLGHRFSIITITGSVIAPTERQIRNVGVGEKLASVRAVEIPVLQLHSDRARTIEAVIEEGRRAIEEDRADSLILGCMTMGFLEVAEEVAPELEVPVINPARASLKFAEALVGAGLSHSRCAYMPPPKLASGEVGSALDLLYAKV
ncbi:MAG: aspartate/glutamate racemase family protein [Chloroflexota bacterium]|nr:aspartate/glutamate racemase family protein [Chloroflexota bacterium]